MSIIADRLGPGTLTFGQTPGDFSMQVTSCQLTPDTAEDDVTPTLGDPEPVPGITTTWTLEGEAVQDWAESNGFVAYCMDNSGSTVAFEFIPNSAKSVKFTGQVQIRAVALGGAVAENLTTSFAFPCKGSPVRGAHTPTAAARTAAQSSKA